MFDILLQGQGILAADEMEEFCKFVKKPVSWTFRISNLGRQVGAYCIKIM